MIARAQAVLAAGGTVWVGDETTLRELPPVRSAWAKRGEQAIVLISGRNARRVIHGAINVQTGELTHIVRERSTQDRRVVYCRLARAQSQSRRQSRLCRRRRPGCRGQSLARGPHHGPDPPQCRLNLPQISMATYLAVSPSHVP